MQILDVQDGTQLVSTSRAAASSGLLAAAPTGAVRGRGWSPTDESGEGVNGCKAEDAERSGDEGPAFSLHSQEGDTEAAIMVMRLHVIIGFACLLVRIWFRARYRQLQFGASRLLLVLGNIYITCSQILPQTGLGWPKGMAMDQSKV